MSDLPTIDELAAIEARAAAATPGPWDADASYWCAGVNDGSFPDWRPKAVLPGQCGGGCQTGTPLVRTVVAGADGRLPGGGEGTPGGHYHIHRFVHTGADSNAWRQIYSAAGEQIIGNYDYEEGGIASTRADAEFIAHAREDIPRLVAAVRALLAEAAK